MHILLKHDLNSILLIRNHHNHHHHHHNISQLDRSQDTKFGAPPPTNRLIDLHNRSSLAPPSYNFNDARKYSDQLPDRTLPQDTTCM